MRTHLRSGEPPRPARTRGKLLAAGAVVVVSSVLLQGCSSSSTSDDASSGGDVKLTFLNQSRGQEEELTKLAAEYSAANGVEITIDTPGPADFPAKLQAAAQSGNMPDIYSAIGQNTMAPFYKAGWAMDLTDELAKDGWGDSFNPAILQMSSFADGNAFGVPAGTYSVHWDIASYGLFVSPKSTGISEDATPETMSDFIAALQGAPGGSDQFSVAASLAPMLLLGYGSNYMSDDEINATITGDASWETDAWAKTFQVFADLRDGGVISNGTIPGGTDDAANVEKSFFNSKTVGAMFDASGAIGVGRTTAADFTDYFATGLPAADDGTQTPRAYAATGKGAAVNPKGDHPKEALAFVKWLTEPDQQKAFSDAAGLIPTSTTVDRTTLSPQIAGLMDVLDSAEVIRNGVTPDVNAAIGAGVQSIVLGERSVDDVLKDVQAAQDLSQ